MKHFNLDELTKSNTAIRKGINNNPSEDIKKKLIRLIEDVLDPIREKYGKPIYVSSGYRCRQLNALVGGAANSQHLKGEAADIKAANNKELFNLILRMIQDKEITVGQLIDEYNYSWIHISLPTVNKHNQILHLK